MYRLLFHACKINFTRWKTFSECNTIFLQLIISLPYFTDIIIKQNINFKPTLVYVYMYWVFIPSLKSSFNFSSSYLAACSRGSRCDMCCTRHITVWVLMCRQPRLRFTARRLPTPGLRTAFYICYVYLWTGNTVFHTVTCVVKYFVQ